MGKYRILGISSGLGVSLYPFKKYVIGNIEPRSIFHTSGNEQWKLNFGEIPLFKKFDPQLQFKKPTAIISSPDCGMGSVFRLSRSKTFGDHSNNKSLNYFFESLYIWKPHTFLFENLNNLFKSFPKSKFKELTRDYHLIIYNVSVSAFGNSQVSRKRLVIVGVNKKLVKSRKLAKKFFKLSPKKELKTCGEIYGDLINDDIQLGCVREDINEIISIHARKRISLGEVQKTWLNRLKGKKRWETEPGFKFSTAPGVYRNMDNDYPSTARKANRQYDERGLTLTPRHLARVQGVPDDFKLYMDNMRLGYSINKARTTVTKTPPMEISIWFKKRLFKLMDYLKK